MLWDQGKIVEGLNAINWSPETIQDLENSVLNGLTAVGCGNVSPRLIWKSSTSYLHILLVIKDADYIVDYNLNGIPQPSCSYQAADQCTGFVPKSCCERLSGAAPVVHVTRLHFFLVGCLFLMSVLFTALAQ